MVRLYVPPLPELASPEPKPDYLLEKFRRATIKGDTVKYKPRNADDSVADYSELDWFVFNVNVFDSDQ